MNGLRIPVCFIALLTLAAPVSATATSEIDSREIKILLDPGAFEDSGAFFEESLDMLRSLAAERGVRLREPGGEAKIKTREIRYFDTEDFALRSNGWVLRQRLKTRGERKADYAELAFKFSSSLRGIASEASVSAQGSYDADEEFEEDIHPVAEDGPWRTRFARRCKVDNLPVFESPRVGEVAEIFPGIAATGLSPDTRLATVGGPLTETRIQPGYLDFGDGVTGDLDLTWLTDASGEVLAAEISYDYPFLSNTRSVQSIWASLQFLPAMHQALGEKWQPGSGKTSIVYERAGYQNP